jgi:hypothetical protein
VLGTRGSSLGSKLVLVIDNHSQRTDSGRRFPVTVRLVTRLVLVLIACSWLFLYLDSIHQRRRAESLIGDLRSLDFATAGFSDIRDLVIRHGGVPPSCPGQDCTFIVWINTRLAQPPFPVEKRTVEVLYSALPYIGVHTWGLGAMFVVRNGKLEGSQTFIAENRIDRLEPDYPRRLIPFGYEVQTVLSDSACRGGHQGVTISHGHPVKFPIKVLHTCVLQTERTSTKRAFDINLRCLNGIFRGCRYDELSPSAWADYSAKDGSNGASVPYK